MLSLCGLCYRGCSHITVVITHSFASHVLTTHLIIREAFELWGCLVVSVGRDDRMVPLVTHVLIAWLYLLDPISINSIIRIIMLCYHFSTCSISCVAVTSSWQCNFVVDILVIRSHMFIDARCSVYILIFSIWSSWLFWFRLHFEIFKSVHLLSHLFLACDIMAVASTHAQVAAVCESPSQCNSLTMPITESQAVDIALERVGCGMANTTITDHVDATVSPQSDQPCGHPANNIASVAPDASTPTPCALPHTTPCQWITPWRAVPVEPVMLNANKLQPVQQHPVPVDAMSELQHLAPTHGRKRRAPRAWVDLSDEYVFECTQCEVTHDGTIHPWREDITISLTRGVRTARQYVRMYALPCRRCGRQLKCIGLAAKRGLVWVHSMVFNGVASLRVFSVTIGLVISIIMRTIPFTSYLLSSFRCLLLILCMFSHHVRYIHLSACLRVWQICWTCVPAGLDLCSVAAWPPIVCLHSVRFAQ